MPIPKAVHQFILTHFRVSLIISLLSWKNPLGKLYISELGNELKIKLYVALVSSTFSWFISNVNPVTISFYNGHEDFALPSLSCPLWFPWRTEQRYSGKQILTEFPIWRIFFPNMLTVLNVSVVQNLIDSQTIKTLLHSHFILSPMS